MIIPFLAISVALLVLAWRSYHLSVRMETGLNTFAVHYLAYAAEVTARRTDVAASSEMFRAADAWQRVERANPSPDFDSLQGWLDQHPWIVSAIYVPDDDPANSIYVTELPNEKAIRGERRTQDFFTASGSVRYTYDAQRLLNVATRQVQRQTLLQEAAFPGSVEIGGQSRMSLTRARDRGLKKTEDGYTMVVALSPPLSDFGIRASVTTMHASTGWENHRVVSVLFGALAIILVAVGAKFAIRGLRKEAEAMSLRAALIANVSHELRTPLSMIRLGAETLKRGQKLKPEEREALEDSILREVVHLSHLVENVLDVARLQRSSNPFAFAPLDPAELVRSVVNTYGSWITSKGFSVELDFGRGLAAQTGLKGQAGDMVFEVREAGGDKGLAVRTLMALAPFKGARPIFIGDDVTDEDGIGAAQALGGYGVLVGDRQGSGADHGLPDVEAVLDWLEAET